MALVNIINVSVMDNPSSFTNPFQFEVTFECLQELSDGKYLIYIKIYHYDYSIHVIDPFLSSYIYVTLYISFIIYL